MVKKKFDICVFGASGFTGHLTAAYLFNHSDIKKIKWAIAGRNKQKLEQIREDFKESYSKKNKKIENKELENILPEIVIADVGDFESLSEMAKQSKVIITTVGPYTRYGEPVIKACIEHKSDYVDLVGEPNFVDLMRYRYHQQALQAGVKIVNACGFDSIPHDLGVLFCVNALREKYKIENQKFLQIECEGFVSTNARFSGGTWHSAINAMSVMLSHMKRKREWKKEGYSGKEQMSAYRKVSAGVPSIFFNREFSQWAIPLPTIDPEIVLRSAQLRDDYGMRFSYKHYALMEKWWHVPLLLLGSMIVFTLAQFRFGREKLGNVISPGEGPDEQRRAQSWFKVDIKAKTGKELVFAQVSGGDPGYTETSLMLAESALCLALQRKKTPKFFGITTPAAGMGEVLIERLQKAGIGFNFLEK
jgi:short subunit dehydrogenase-like uncharacterized protein